MQLTQDQCDSFNAYQRSGFMHPFTCGVKGHEGSDDLVAHEDGFKCPGCDYVQGWAHSWMLDWSWEKTFDLAKSRLDVIRPWIETQKEEK